MADINTTLQALEPIIGPVSHIMNIVQYLVGGIFGLYLILVILRWYESRKLARLMRDVKDQLVGLNKHFGVKVETQNQKLKRKIRKIVEKEL